MKNLVTGLLSILMLLIQAGVSGQQKTNIPELLGYPANTKLLIIHADDMGLSHSTNAAVIKAFENGCITSGSIMIPCPWAPEIAAYVKAHPTVDVGIHFTTNAEWKYYKCGGVLPSSEIPSLLDKDGNFYPTLQQVALLAKPEEVEKELRAQIDWALAHGVQPTHLDSHMGSMYVSPAIFRVALKVASEYKLPVSLPFNLVNTAAPILVKEITPDMIGVDNFIMLPGEALNGDWKTMYTQMINSLVPGLNELIVHLSYDNDEMKAIAIDHEDYGSAWRQKDLDMVCSDEFKKLLKDNNVQLVTWKQVQEAVYKQ
jgi:chitin disaccharide deacetylase